MSVAGGTVAGIPPGRSRSASRATTPRRSSRYSTTAMVSTALRLLVAAMNVDRDRRPVGRCPVAGRTRQRRAGYCQRLVKSHHGCWRAVGPIPRKFPVPLPWAGTRAPGDQLVHDQRPLTTALRPCVHLIRAPETSGVSGSTASTWGPRPALRSGGAWRLRHRRGGLIHAAPSTPGGGCRSRQPGPAVVCSRSRAKTGQPG